MAPRTPLSGEQALLFFLGDERVQEALLKQMEADAEKRLIDHRIVRPPLSGSAPDRTGLKNFRELVLCQVPVLPVL